jgi:hypothetical protein
MMIARGPPPSFHREPFVTRVGARLAVIVRGVTKWRAILVGAIALVVLVLGTGW